MSLEFFAQNKPVRSKKLFYEQLQRYIVINANWIYCYFVVMIKEKIKTNLLITKHTTCNIEIIVNVQYVHLQTLRMRLDVGALSHVFAQIFLESL